MATHKREPKMPAGVTGETRPQMVPLILRRWRTTDEMDAAVDAYVNTQQNTERPLTYAGMARVIGVDPRTMRGYQEERTELPPEWLAAVKNAARRVEEQDEELARGKTCVGAIFALKQRGWSDRQELSGPGGGPIQQALDVTVRFVDAADSDPVDK